jgi:hypothetical protein
MIRRSLLAMTAVLLIAVPLIAQTTYAPTPPLALGDSLFALPTAHIPAEGIWEVKFTHRFQQSSDQGNLSTRIHSLFGLDSNADVGIGLSYVARRDLQFSIIRTNALDDIEGAVKYIVFEQARALPASLALRGGFDWRTAAGLHDRSSFFGQAVLSRAFGRRVEIVLVPTYATNVGRASSGNSDVALFKHAANVPVGAALMLSPSLSIVSEFVPKNHDLPKTITSDFGWAFGLKRAIGGHYFEILLTDLPTTQVDQYVSTTYLGGAIHRGDLHLGFNIERRFGKPKSRT